MFRTPAPARPSATRAGAGRPDDQTHPTMHRASGTRGADKSTLTRLEENTREQTLNARWRPTQLLTPSGSADQNVRHRSVKCFRQRFGRVIEPAEHRRSQHCRERMCSFIASRASKPSCRCRRPDRVTGPARVRMPRLQRRRPDARLVDVVPGTGRPGDPLGMPHPYPAARPLARSGCDEVTVGLTGTRAHGSWATSTLPILSNSVGTPQYPVAKSIRLQRDAGDSVLALPAGDEAA